MLSARGLARSLARSQLPPRFRPLVLRTIRRPRSAFVVPPWREPRTWSGPDHGGDTHQRRGIERERKGAGSDDARVPRGLRRHDAAGGRSPVDGVENCARASQPLATKPPATGEEEGDVANLPCFLHPVFDLAKPKRAPRYFFSLRGFREVHPEGKYCGSETSAFPFPFRKKYREYIGGSLFHLPCI